MMNCMGQGAAATVVGGIRIADWALALTVLLIGLLAVIAVVAIIRTLVMVARAVIDLWRRRSGRRRAVRPGAAPEPSEGGAT